MSQYRTLLNLFAKITKLQYAAFFRLNEGGPAHPGQFHFLCFLAENDGISQAEMAKLLCIKAPTINVMMKRLTRAGLVRTERDQRDHRVTRMFLTEEGARRSKQALTHIEQFESKFFEGFSQEQLENLEYYFKKIIKNLEQEKEAYHA